MQDSERRRSLRRPIRHREEPDVSNEEYDEEYSDSEDEEDFLAAFVLPEHRLRFALLVGALTGILMIAIHFLVPFLDVAAFQKAATLGDKMSYDTAVAVAGLDCLSTALDIVVCGVLGYVIGRYAVQRRLGFFAGLLAGIVLYLGISIISYLPGYPGNANIPAFSPTFILPLIIIALFYGIVGGLVSLLVTWITTRRHPYYYHEEA
ncbi:MAG TPA: hypothetical protein VGT82_18055 [Ktedonobacteraceae bacterium]|nr:hypothetical protein [Ktedonobacteraceae bacterium]